MFPIISLQKSSGEQESIPVSSCEAEPTRTHFLWDLQPSQNLALDGLREVMGLQNAQNEGVMWEERAGKG